MAEMKKTTRLKAMTGAFAIVAMVCVMASGVMAQAGDPGTTMTKEDANNFARRTLLAYYYDDRGGPPCPSGKPGYACKGFFLTAFEQDNDYWFQPDPDKDRMSYTFMRRSSATNPFGPTGVMLFPFDSLNRLTGSSAPMFPRLHCGFPADGGSDMRENNGCGEITGIPVTGGCQSLGIYTASDWFKVYDLSDPMIGFDTCGFAFTGDDNAADTAAYDALHTIITGSNIRQTSGMPWNEYVFHTWPRLAPNLIPVLGFFYMPDFPPQSATRRSRKGGAFQLPGDQLDLVKRRQLSYYRASGVYAPVVRIIGNFPDVRFEARPEDQSPEIPDTVQYGPG